MFSVEGDAREFLTFNICLFSMMQPTFSTVASRYFLSFVLVGLLLLATTTSKQKWIVEAQQMLGGRVSWIACVVIMVFSHLARRSFKRRT